MATLGLKEMGKFLLASMGILPKNGNLPIEAKGIPDIG